MQFLDLDPKTLVADEPFGPGDVEAAAARGVTMIVSNRPDGEEPDQPSAAEIEAAARAAGLDFVHVPVVDRLSPDKVDALRAALARTQGRALIFCRSGTRSAYLWAMARAAEGVPVDELVHRAGLAGYNIRPLLPWLKPRA